MPALGVEAPRHEPGPARFYNAGAGMAEVAIGRAVRAARIGIAAL